MGFMGKHALSVCVCVWGGIWPVPVSTKLLLFIVTLVTPHNEPFCICPPSQFFSSLLEHTHSTAVKARCYNTALAP